jgi:hypothetical protein
VEWFMQLFFAALSMSTYQHLFYLWHFFAIAMPLMSVIYLQIATYRFESTKNNSMVIVCL